MSCTAARTVATARSSSCKWGSSPCSLSSPGTQRAPTGSRSQSPTRSCSRFSFGSGPRCTGPTHPNTVRWCSATSPGSWCRSERCSRARAWRKTGGWPSGPPWSSARSHWLSCTCCVPLDDSLGIRATHSMAERYGLFIIIVLGEVVLGVVDGLLAVGDRDFRTVATGLLGLGIAFGFWWTYFDYVGRRLPRQDGGSLALWLYSQLPIALAVAAAGAGMVSLVEHAADARTPEPSGWLLAGSVSALLIALVAAIVSLAD